MPLIPRKTITQSSAGPVSEVDGVGAGGSWTGTGGGPGGVGAAGGTGAPLHAATPNAMTMMNASLMCRPTHGSNVLREKNGRPRVIPSRLDWSFEMAEDPESTFHLIDRARAGDQAAIERLFDRHLKPLRRWARGRLPRWARDLADTDDLVQETLLQTFNRIEDFEPRRVGALQAYLRQAVLNRIRDELRRKGRRPDSTELDGLEVDRTASPLEQAIGQEAVERYERALARLRPEEQEAVIGRVEMGYTYEELADALDKPTPDAARKAAERALVRLAEEMTRAD